MYKLFNHLLIMKKQNKKANSLQPKRLQLDKTIISSFDANLVKGGGGVRGTYTTCVSDDCTARLCIQHSGIRTLCTK